MGIPDGASLDGKKFDILEEGFAEWVRDGIPIDSKDANFAMHVTGVEELEAYARRFPNGSANNPVERNGNGVSVQNMETGSVCKIWKRGQCAKY